MEEKKTIRIKFKTAVILIIIVALILGICGANVYASTHGYGNVFFLIKYMITGEKPQISDGNDIFSDRDIETREVTIDEYAKKKEEVNNNEDTQIKIDENRLKEIINNAIIDVQKKFQTSDTGYFVKYFEIKRIINDKNLDIYVWTEYGTTDNSKKILSSTAIPVKLIIGLNNYSLINIDVPSDDTDYKRYFPAISDKLIDIEYKNKDTLYEETYYVGQSTAENISSTSASDLIKSKLLDKNWLKDNTLIKSANGNSSSIDEQEYKFAVIKEQDTQNPVVVLVVTAEKILTENTFVIRYINNNVSIEKVSEGHYQHIQTLTNENYYATVSAHMGDWAYELLEVTSNDIGVVDRNHGKVGQDEYEYSEIDEFERNYNLQPVENNLNENNLNRFLNSQK